jgi:hypothetical protein
MKHGFAHEHDLALTIGSALPVRPAPLAISGLARLLQRLHFVLGFSAVAEALELSATRHSLDAELICLCPWSIDHQNEDLEPAQQWGDRPESHDAHAQLCFASNLSGLVFKLIESAEQSWRRVRAPEMIASLLEGIPFKHGVPVTDSTPVQQPLAA